MANHFARFKKNPDRLTLLGYRCFSIPTFEKKLHKGLGGIPPNLDVFLENDECVIGVESKFLETLSLKKSYFSTSYDKKHLPHCEPPWMKLIESAKNARKRYLDVAQLVKHYLGLNNYLRKNKINKKIYLLYLYWKPVNTLEIEEFQKHDQEVEEFKRQVAGSYVEFKSVSYPELWEAWKNEQILSDHARRLMERYSVVI